MSAHSGLATPIRLTATQARLAAVLCGLFVAYAGITYRQFGGHMIQDGDFFALWSYGAVAARHPTADLYDAGRLHELQVALGMDPIRDNPFPYLPTFLPVVRALAAMPVSAAFLVWTGLGAAAFSWAVASGASRRTAVGAALMSPAVTICVVLGQGGLLCAALMLGGLRLMRRRPWLAGALLGLLTLKPQLGMLVPVALVSAGAWRCVAAACAAAAALALASLAFGSAAWGEWLAALPGYQAWFATWGANVRLLPTVTALLTYFGASEHAARIGQGCAALAMACVVWRLFRAGPDARAIAAFPAATLLATPHALVYDMPMLAGGVILALAARPSSLAEAPWPILALAAPALMVSSPAAWPVAAPLVACCLVWTLARRMSGPAPEPLRAPAASVGLVPAPQA